MTDPSSASAAPTLPEAAMGLLGALPEPTLLLTQGGQIVAANEAARREWAGEPLPPGEQGAGGLLAQLADEAEGFEGYLRRCGGAAALVGGSFVLRGGEGAAVNYRCQGAKAGPGLVVLRFWRQEGEAGRRLRRKVAALTAEVAQRKEAERSLERSQQALWERVRDVEQTNRLKDAFLATVSHELRTPLNAVLNWARLLRRGEVPTERTQQALESIERNARAQAQIVEDLMDVSRIATGKLQLVPRTIDLIEVVEGAIDTVRPAAEAKGISVRAELHPEPTLIEGDPERLSQVFWNILTNAVKFSPRGGQIEVRQREDEEGPELAIRDEGQGIAHEFLPHVFEQFRQAEGGTRRRAGGLGLGLAIARNLVELHGGRIEARSEGLGKGATFVVRLPWGQARTSTPPLVRPVSRPDLSTPLANLRVVAVDDDQDAIALLVLLLERSGAHVMAHSSAADAFEAVQRERPDLLVSDIGMPVEDGYQLIQRVRSLPEEAGGRTPAVALSAFCRPEDRAYALRQGFQEHLPKPIDAAVLVQTVARLLGR